MTREKGYPLKNSFVFNPDKKEFVSFLIPNKGIKYFSVYTNFLTRPDKQNNGHLIYKLKKSKGKQPMEGYTEYTMKIAHLDSHPENDIEFQIIPCWINGDFFDFTIDPAYVILKRRFDI
jgi:hypothetical protein